MKMLWKAFLEMPDPVLRRGWSSQIPFCWQIQREVGISPANSPLGACPAVPGITNRHKSTFSSKDRQLLSQVDASALFCCDFKGSKAQTVKINFPTLSGREEKNSLNLIYENINSEEAAKQQAKRKNSEIKHRQQADKEANETVLKENRSQGEQEVIPRLILHSADVPTAFWFTAARQNTFDAESTKKSGAEKRNEVQEAA